MKKLFFGCALALYGFTMPLAFSQDYCCPPQDYGYIQSDACCDEFAGFYIGGNVGVISQTAHRNDLDGFLTDNSGWTTVDTNVTAGVQLGYDWQCCNKVFGFVVDWNWANTDRRHRDNPAVSDNFINTEFDWFTTIRARAGLAVCDALVYVTAGAVVGRFETTWHDDPDEFNFNDTRWGWTGGVGTELKFWCNWSLGAEVLFLHFNEDTRSSTVGATEFNFGHSDSAWVGRILLNYRFGDLF